jgi:branched-chain amino acid transport system substrate-binding protein
MRERKSVRSNQWRRSAQLGMAVSGAILLLLAVLVCADARKIPTKVLAVGDQHSATISNGQVITIGTAAPLSGPIADLGWQQVNTVQLAVSQTNEAGGIDIGGTLYSVTLVVADSGCNATQAITAANELLDAGAVAVVGHACSSASIAAASLYRAADVAMVSPSSTAPPLTLAGYTTTFRTIPHDGSGAMKLAEYFATVGNMRTAILVVPGDWATTADMYENRYASLGGTVTSRRIITATADITPALTAIQAENVDVIFVTDVFGDRAGEVSRVAYTLGMPQPVAWLEISDDYISVKAGVDAAEGDFGTTGGRRVTDMVDYLTFEAAYLAASFSNAPNPGPFSPYAYDATRIILNAVSRAATTDTLAIRGEIAATGAYTGVVGIYQGFDANGDIIPQWARVEVVENGEWTPALVEVEILPGRAGIVDLENTLGQTTTIEIPAGTATETLVITYTLVATVTNAGVPTMTMLGQHAIRLESNVSISSPMTVTVEYTGEDMAGVNEATLALYTWDGSQWLDAEPCGGYVRDLDNNVLRIGICHFSDYVLLGELEYRVYLPLVLKAFP